MNHRLSISRRSLLLGLCSGASMTLLGRNDAFGVGTDDASKKATQKGLVWLSRQQTASGGWISRTYPVAVTSLASIALICSGSTTTQGPYAKNIRSAVDYLVARAQTNGLIGNPRTENRYTYGHGFAMLFLSQVLGEEEDVDRRDELIAILEKAVEYSVAAQTKAGGWGYVGSSSNTFDEGSTTITQVQGLRGCRNAGIVVPKKCIEQAKEYIYKCQNKDGGISYSTKSIGSSRPAITAAALAALYNAGDYKSEYIPKMWAYSRKSLHSLDDDRYGHWHYTYLYYSQVVYRQGDAEWEPYRDRLYQKLVNSQSRDGSWSSSNIGAAYSTSMNLIMLQLDLGYLPIYQK